MAKFVLKKYIDYRQKKTAAECADGDFAVFTGMLQKLEKRQMKGNPKREYIYGILADDGGAEIKLFMFSNLYLYDYYGQLKGTRVAVCGKITKTPEFGYAVTQVDDMMSEDMYRPHFKCQYKKYAGISEGKMLEYIKESLKFSCEPLEKEVCEKVYPFAAVQADGEVPQAVPLAVSIL